MRRALVPILATILLGGSVAPAAAQGYDRYGGGAANANAMPPWYQPPARVLNWSGKQVQQAPPMPMAQPMPQPMAYPQQQAYPQPQHYPQAGYPQPTPQAYGYPQQGRYPSIQGNPNQQMPPYREGPLQGMPTYEQMQEQKARGQVAQPPQPFPIMNTPPQGAWAYQQGAPQQQPYPQQAYPQQAYPPQAYPQAQPYAAPVAYPQPQPQQYPTQPYPQAAQPMMAAPAAAPRPVDPTVTAAPTTPVQSQPLPTNIYAPAAPRADIQPGMPSGLPVDVQSQPSGGGAGSTALASLDYRSLGANDPRNPGVRHYSVHRPFGMTPDPAPIPPVDNQVIIAAQETEIVDNNDVGLRGVGMDQDDNAKKASDD